MHEAKRLPGVCVVLGSREFSALITMVACLPLLSLPRHRGFASPAAVSLSLSTIGRRVSNLFSIDSFCIYHLRSNSVLPSMGHIGFTVFLPVALWL